MEWTIQSRNKGTTKYRKGIIYTRCKKYYKIETKTVNYELLNCEWNK